MVKICLKCNSGASFGKKGTKKAEYCANHKPADYIDVRKKKCLKCFKKPNFGKKGTKKAEYCVDHKPIDYVNVKSKTCLKCDTRANFGKKGTKIAEYCSEHKPADYVDVKNKTCLQCEKLATFGKKGTKKAEYCLEHKPAEYANVKHKTCLQCEKLATFGKKGTKKAEYCLEHKPAEYVDVKNKNCLKCSKKPYFGKKGTKKAEYCVDHKPIDYVNVKSKTCLKCEKIPIFGKKDSKKAEYCVDHKPAEYVDVKNKTCLKCSKQAHFGKKDTKKAEYCTDHKPPDYVDVKHKTCVIKDCTNRAYYGRLYHKKEHCLRHKENGEYNYKKINPKCKIPKCKEKPFYTNEESNYPLRCEKHKLENDKNIVEKKCPNCGIFTFIKIDGFCDNCSEWNDDKIRHRKEYRIYDVLKANNIKFTHDKRAENECSLKRTDFVIDCGNQIIVVEVDENQHKTYPCYCEQTRMVTIFNDFGGIPLTFVRYNPDNYIDFQGKLINGSLNNLGRETRLLKVIKSLEMHPPKEVRLAVIYLYYDGENGQNIVDKLDYDSLEITRLIDNLEIA